VLIEQEERTAEETGGAAPRVGASSACIVTCPTALQRVLDPNTALAVWQRNLDPQIVAELDSLMIDEVDDLSFTTATDALESALAEAMGEGGYPDMPSLRRDIAMLADRHAAIAGDRKVRVRLEVVETDACWKFHTDYVKVRTITTYLGRGTQWIEAASAEEASLSEGLDIRQLEPGEIGMFKGRLWQKTPMILHRSPPIGGSDEQRLVLVIDPASCGRDAVIRLGGACS
jgi:hypothetical protein